MEFDEVLRRRRMVRAYAPETVPEATVRAILDAAIRAPSAGFAQGQSFVVVTEQATRFAIAELADEATYVERGFDPWLSVAPVHVVICTSREAYESRYARADKGSSDPPAEWPVPYWFVDAGAALMLLLLSAVDHGLAAGFIGAHRLKGIENLLGLPDDVTPIGLMTVGRPAPDRRSGSLDAGRRPFEETVHFERW